MLFAYYLFFPATATILLPQGKTKYLFACYYYNKLLQSFCLHRSKKREKLGKSEANIYFSDLVDLHLPPQPA